VITKLPEPIILPAEFLLRKASFKEANVRRAVSPACYAPFHPPQSGNCSLLDAERASRFRSSTVARFIRLGVTERNHHAPIQEAPQLGLLWGPADLNEHWRRNQRNDGEFQTGLVFSPRPPLVSVCGHQNGGVVDDRSHAGRGTALFVYSTRRRATMS